MSRNSAIWALSILAALSVCGSAVIAQDAPTPAAPAGGDEGASLPEMGQVVDAIEKATAPAPEGGADWSAPVKLAIVFIGLALLPSLLVMTTSFTRIVIVLSFVRRALTTQSIPPNIAIIGLAMFLTLFTMAGTFAEIDKHALQPYLADEMNFQDACSKGSSLLKVFMVKHTRDEDLELFLGMAKLQVPATVDELPAHVAIPAFAISEFRKAFEMGCLLFIPFLLVDLVVASILLSAGMMMLPPAIVSLPLKIILFVLVDGWRILAESLVLSFR